MCKTKTLIYTFTNRAALDECLDDISRNYADKEISYAGVNFLDGDIPERDTLPYEKLIYYGIFDERDIDLNHGVTIQELKELVGPAQNIIGELMVEL